MLLTEGLVGIYAALALWLIIALRPGQKDLAPCGAAPPSRAWGRSLPAAAALRGVRLPRATPPTAASQSHSGVGYSHRLTTKPRACKSTR
jgi:hypothetical protein